jgi:hypothetical protein
MTISNQSSLNWPQSSTTVNTMISTGGTGSSIGITSNGAISGATQYSSAFQIRNNAEPVLQIDLDGKITTKAGTISVEDWIQVVKLMRQFIIDVSNDQETAKKYPYLKDAAHQWMMDELRK